MNLFKIKELDKATFKIENGIITMPAWTWLLLLAGLVFLSVKYR